jgi:heptosyltransferase-2
LFARIPQRIGFVGEARRLLLTDARRLDEHALPLMVERFASLGMPGGAGVPVELSRPRLRVEPAECAMLLEQLRLDRPAHLVCFCPGAEYGPAKRWPPQHFGQLADFARRRRPHGLDRRIGQGTRHRRGDSRKQRGCGTEPLRPHVP